MNYAPDNKKQSGSEASLSKYGFCVTAVNKDQVKVIAELKFSDDMRIISEERKDHILREEGNQ